MVIECWKRSLDTIRSILTDLPKPIKKKIKIKLRKQGLKQMKLKDFSNSIHIVSFWPV